MYKFIQNAIKLGVVSVLLCAQASYASEADLQKELRDYIEIFSGTNFIQQRKVMGTLVWSGISDPALYDLFEKKLLETYTGKEKKTVQAAAWFVKGLALSGNPKYIPTLNEVANNGSKKVRKHVDAARQRLVTYQSWNPVISKGLKTVPTGQLAQARVVNMLNSEYPRLVTIGAKRVYYAHSDNSELVALAAKILQKGYQQAKNDSDQISSMAWLIKALAESGDVRYKALLSEVAEKANNKKVVKYAKKYKDYL